MFGFRGNQNQKYTNPVIALTCNKGGFLGINDLACFDPVFKYYEPHEGEIVSVKCCPHNKDLFLTSGTDGQIRVYVLDQVSINKTVKLFRNSHVW